MEKKNIRTSAGRLVMEVFHHHKAYNKESAISLNQFKNVPISNDMIGYTFGNMIEEKVIVPVDDKFYLDEQQFKRLEKKFNRVYWVMMFAPFVALLILLFFLNFDKIMKWIGI